jgi:hypothetical protein
MSLATFHRRKDCPLALAAAAAFAGAAAAQGPRL